MTETRRAGRHPQTMNDDTDSWAAMELSPPQKADAVPDAVPVGTSDLVRLLISNHSKEELAIGYLRYEMVRRMSPRLFGLFGELHKKNLSGRFFDDLVDEALCKWKQPNTPVRDEAKPRSL